jgi:putative sigma-54 modulation protein
MRLVLTGRNVEVTPPLRQQIERRVRKLERVLNDSVVSAQVVLTQEKYRRIVEISVHARGDHMLHGLGAASAWPLSLKQAVEKIEQQAHRLKGKWARRKRGAAGAKAVTAESAAAPPPAPAPPAGRRVVRAVRYPVKPMTLEDAASAVDRGADPFLVFRNATTEAVNILYRRKDGRLGLIEPDA